MNLQLQFVGILSSILFQTSFINCANILVVMPVPIRSHVKSYQPLFEELIVRGHNVTLISGFSLSHHLQSKYTFVDVSNHFNLEGVGKLIKTMKDKSIARINIFMPLSDFLSDYAEDILKLEEIQNIIQSEDHYDLVMAQFFFMDVFFALGSKFNAPVIGLSPQKMFSTYEWILGNPFPASHIPNHYFQMTEKMSLPSRINNFMFSFISVLYHEFVTLPKAQAQMEKYFHFDRESTPQIKDILKNTSVTLLITHYLLDYVKPNLPNIIQVAGLHFKPVKSLPKAIEKFINEADDGLIYFSIGSFLHPKDFKSLGDTLISIFEKLPQRVIMKWDAKFLTYVPVNVLVEKWIPQNDILNHPKCRLFITHGGLHSSLETLNASVPVVGIPFFVDQMHNTALMEYYGIGVMVHSEEVSSKLAAAIDNVLSNPKYKANIERKSMIFREHLLKVKPLDTAIFWIDHVIKYKNTDHLKSAALQLSWYELYSLDVCLVLLVAMLLAVYFMKCIIIKIIKILIRKKGKVLFNAKFTDEKSNHLKCN